jgi:hypothetical protein
LASASRLWRSPTWAYNLDTVALCPTISLTVTDEMRTEPKKLVEEGKTGAEIAKALKISLPSVYNVKKALGLIKKPLTAWLAVQPDLTLVQIKEKWGMTCAVLAAHYGRISLGPRYKNGSDRRQANRAKSCISYAKSRRAVLSPPDFRRKTHYVNKIFSPFTLSISACPASQRDPRAASTTNFVFHPCEPLPLLFACAISRARRTIAAMPPSSSLGDGWCRTSAGWSRGFFAKS